MKLKNRIEPAVNRRALKKQFPLQYNQFLKRLPRLCPALLSVVLILAGSPRVRADYTTTINPSTSWGVWEGWGCSLAWWGNVFGNRDDLADIIFTTKTTTLNGESFPGLGLNI